MGADIYLKSVFEEQQKKYRPLRDMWETRRAHVPPDSEAYQEAQDKLQHYRDKQFERGYYRDSYNASSLFSLLGMSWWELPFDADGYLSVNECRILLERISIAMRDAYPINFRTARDAGGLFAGDTDEAVDQYFCNKFARLTALLEEAIALKEPLLCSV